MSKYTFTHKGKTFIWERRAGRHFHNLRVWEDGKLDTFIRRPLPMYWLCDQKEWDIILRETAEILIKSTK